MRIKDWWYRFKRRWILPPLVKMGKSALRLSLSTCRIEIKGGEHLIQAASENRCILMLWHNRIAVLPEVLLKMDSPFTYCAFVSQSRDGEILALLANSYKQGRALRVPHDARHQALSKMISLLREKGEVMLVTPDGPRGPRYQVKPGIVLAAKEAPAYIVPFTWSTNRFWQLRTWDKLILPKPFSRIYVIFGEPILVPKDTNQTLEEHAQVLQQTLLQLDQETITVCGATFE